MVNFKSKIFKLMTWLIFVLALSLIVGCEVEVRKNPIVIEAETEIVAGRYYDFGLKDESISAEVTYVWSVSDPEMLEINTQTQKIRGLKEGTATLIVESSIGDTASIVIKISAPDRYSITYHFNGGTCDDYRTDFTVFDDFYHPNPTREGYIFAGWYQDPKFLGSKYTRLMPDTTGDKTFYAKWNPVQYDITYVLFNNAYGVPVSTKESYDTDIIAEDYILMTPTRSGYEFAGWYDNAELAGSPVTLIEKGSKGDKTFYASWTIVTYTVTLMVDGLTYKEYTYNIESDPFTFDQPEKQFYQFLGWFDNEEFAGDAVEGLETGSFGDKVFYALFEELEYDITYELNGGSAEDLVTSYRASETVILVDATKAGYIFKGWYDNPEFTGDPIANLEVGSSGDKTFYALFEAIEYEIKLYVDGVVVDTITYTIESADVELAKLTKAGYAFSGWFASADLSGEEVLMVPTGSMEDQEFFAEFELVTYTVSYQLDGADATGLVESYTVLEGFTLPDLSKVGFTFVGWYDNAGFNGDPVTEVVVGTTGDKTFYALFEAINYEIKLYVDGALFDTVTYNIVNGYTLPVLTTPGYIFSGWFDNAELDGDAVAAVAAGSTGDKEFYGEFEVQPFTLDLSYDGTLYVGQSDYVDAVITPEGGQFTISYSVENDAIISVDQDGKVTGLAPGTTKVYATVAELGLVAEVEITVEIEVTDVVVSNAVASLDPNATFEYLGVTYVVGVNAFATLAEGLAATVSGVVYVDSGDYDGATITKSVQILGANHGINPNTQTRVAETYFKTNVVLSADNILISGVSLKNTARITADLNKAIANITIDGLHIDDGSTLSDGNSAVVDFKADVLAATRTNITLTNSRYEETAKRRMMFYGNNIINLNITNNVGLGSTATTLFTDCIKLIAMTDGYAVSGEVNITDNYFRGYDQYTVWITNYGPGTYNFMNNTHIDNGQNYAHTGYRLALSGVTVDPAKGNYYINIMFNSFDDCPGVARLQNAGATANNWFATVKYNIFVNPLSDISYYVTNEAAGSREFINAEYNYWGTINPVAGYFIGVSSWANYFTAANQVPAVLPVLTLDPIATLDLGEQVQIVVNFNLNLADFTFAWESLNADVVEVDADGVIIAKGSGSTKVRLTILELGISAEVDVVVNDHVVTDTVVSKATLLLNNGEMFKYRGKDYIVGVDAFATIAEAIAATQTGIVYVLEGEYTESFTVNKGVTIIGPNSDRNPNTVTRRAEALITGTVTVAANNVTISGFEFTTTAKVRVNAGTNNFAFTYNNVHDTAAATTSWVEAAGYVNGFVVMTGSSGAQIKNVRYDYNRFENIGDAVINGYYITGFEANYNVFKNFKRDAIRFDTGGPNNGIINIKNNEFTQPNQQTGYMAVYFRIYGHTTTQSDLAEITIANNYFKNIGNTNSTSVYNGAISFRNYQEAGAKIVINDNIFETCVNYLRIRNNGGGGVKWSCEVFNNAFIGLPVDYYHVNKAGSDTDTTNPPLAVFGANYYEDNDGNPITDLEVYAAKFKDLATKGTALGSITDIAEGVMNEARLEEELDKVINSASKHVAQNYLFPGSDVAGVEITWNYKEGQDPSIHDLVTGLRLKNMLRINVRTLVVTATYGDFTVSKEVDVNFGVTAVGETAIFYRQSANALSADEDDRAVSLLGWSGYTLHYKGYVTYLVKSALIEVNSKAALLAITEFTYSSCALLFKYTGTETFTLDRSEYTKISSAYGAVVIRDGLVSQASTTTFTLQQGDYLYVPQYLDNVIGETGVIDATLGKAANYKVGDSIEIKYWLSVLNAPEYSIVYNLDGAENHESNPSSYSVNTLPITLMDPYKEDYVFLGWYDTSDFSGDPVTYLDLNTTGEIVLYALFEKGTPIIKYLITLNVNGGVLGEYPKFYSTADEDPTVLPYPNRPGYRFIGWYANQEFTGNPVTQIELGETGNKVFYARWAEIIPQGVYTVDFELNGGVWGYTTKEAMIYDFLSDFYDYLVGLNVVSSSVSRDAFITGGSAGDATNNRFAGGSWYQYFPNETYSGLSHTDNHLFMSNKRDIDDSAKLFIQDSRYNEKWLPLFDYVNTMVVTVNSAQSLWGDQTVGGYRFYHFITRVSAPWAAAANWFKVDSVPNFAPDFNKYSTGGGYVELGVPVRPDHTFLGWYDNPEFIGERIYGIGNNASGNKVFYAKWSVATPSYVTVGVGGDYETLEEALAAVAAGSVIQLLAGEYNGNYLVTTNNITILGPNASRAALAVRDEEAVISGTITVADGVNGFELNGVSLTGKVETSGTVDNVTIRSLLVDGDGMVVLATVNNLIVSENTVNTTNNFVEALSVTNVYFTDNVIESGLSAFVAGEVAGNNQFSFNNIYKLDEVVFVAGKNSSTYVAFVGNVILNVCGVIDFADYQLGSTINGEFVVQFNIFTDVYGDAVIKVSNKDALADTWIGLVNYNIFQSCPADLFVTNYPGDPDGLINVYNNYLSDADNEVAKFVGCFEFSVSDGYLNREDVPTINRDGIVEVVRISVSGVKTQIDQFATAQIVVEVDPICASDQRVKYESSNKEVATVSETGLIKALSTGNVTITITSVANPSIKYNLHLEVIAPVRVEIFSKGQNTLVSNVLNLNENLELVANTYFAGESPVIVWSTSDDTVITVIDGVLTAVGAGTALIRASIQGTEYYSEIGFTVLDDYGAYSQIMELITNAHVTTVISLEAKVTGYQFIYYKLIQGSASKLFFQNTPVTEYIAPLGSNRPGTKHPSTEYVVIHDTASSASNATAAAHASYVSNGGGGTSWHYSIGNDGIYHQIPDDEVAYHAGDGSRRYGLDNTGVPVTVEPAKAKVTLDAAGNYLVNGQATGLRPYDNTQTTLTKFDPTIYKTADLVDNGIQIVAIDGYYYLGKTYFNTSFKKVGNSGGNYQSIGIETMVNEGSDIYMTWQITAKHSAQLLINTGLTTDRVRPHNFFSGKNCPQTMRDNGLWENFKSLVEFEYEYATKFAEYSLTFTSHNTQLLDNNGRVISLPLATTSVGYTVKVTTATGTQEITLYTVIPGVYR